MILDPLQRWTLPESLEDCYPLSYNSIVKLNERLEEAKKLISDVNEDAQMLLGMIQMAVPLPAAVIKRVAERVAQAKKIFNSEIENGNS